MEMKDVKNIAAEMQTKADLLRLINSMKKDELNEQFRAFTMKQLGWYCNPKHVFNRYVDFKIPKKSGGERTISSPGTRSYKYLLHYVGLILQSIYEPSSHAMGFIPGKSVVANAKVHMGMNYVFNIDLKDFFPSIERARIAARLQVYPFNFTKEVALTIAGLCTMQVLKGENKEGKKEYLYVLPQGSPASPIITNLMCDKFDFLLSKLAKQFGLHYTRYADDITFSSLHNVYQPESDFRKKLESIITGQGFTINQTKTRLNKRGTRQEVTGLIVSDDRVNVTRKYIRDLRGLLFIWERYGYGAAESRLHQLKDYHRRRNRMAYRCGSSLSCVVGGKLAFLRMVKGEDDSTYIKLKQRFDKLMKGCEKNQPQHTKLYYCETYTLAEFEKKFNTIINFSTYKHESPSKWKKDGEESCFATFTLNGVEKVAEIKQSVDVSTPKDKLCISYCQTPQMNEGFWLIHEPYQSQHFEEKVDIDELNKELDALLNNG